MKYLTAFMEDTCGEAESSSSADAHFSQSSGNAPAEPAKPQTATFAGSPPRVPAEPAKPPPWPPRPPELARWPLPWRQRWADRAEELQANGSGWREAECQAFAEIKAARSTAS